MDTAWQELPVAALRAYLTARGVDFRELGCLEKAELVSLAFEKAKTLGEGRLHVGDAARFVKGKPAGK